MNSPFYTVFYKELLTQRTPFRLFCPPKAKGTPPGSGGVSASLSSSAQTEAFGGNTVYEHDIQAFHDKIIDQFFSVGLRDAANAGFSAVQCQRRLPLVIHHGGVLVTAAPAR